MNSLSPMPEIQSSTSSDLSDSQLKWSYFFVTNKILLRRLAVILLVLANCGLWGYSIAGLSFWALDYQRLSEQTDSLLYSPSANMAAVEAARPRPLTVSEVQQFGGEGERFDLMAQVGNPNADWLAEFDYSFIDGASSIVYPAFALPGQGKVLLALGQVNSESRLEVSNVRWRRVLDFEDLRNNRERFQVENETYLPAKKAGDPSRVKFTLSNLSPYSYWDAGIVVFLYSGSNIAAVNYLTIPQLKSDSQREVEFNWSRPLPDIDAVEVIPEVNYLDPNNIMPPSS